MIFFAPNLRTPKKRRAYAKQLADPMIPLLDEERGRAKYARMKYPEFAAAWDGLYAQLVKLYGEPKSGFNRHTFITPEAVYKMPRTLSWGASSSIREVRAYEENLDSLPVAACRIVYHRSGIPIVVMEPVEIDQYALLPVWACRIDGSQVGRARDRGWVVYDAGEKPW